MARSSGRISAFLFWLSLVPVVTEWMGENHIAPLPTATYGAVLVLAAVAYLNLDRTNESGG